jgi:hypothetical protein
VPEKTPRAILRSACSSAGFGSTAWFDKRVRQPDPLFLPAAALMPAAIGAWWKCSDMLYAGGTIPELIGRPSETIETYLYFFVLAYLIVFARRIHALENEGEPSPNANPQR